MSHQLTPPPVNILALNSAVVKSPPPPRVSAVLAANKQRLIFNFGSIESVLLPQDWRGYERGYIEMGPRIFLQLTAPSQPITLKLAMRTRSISKESRISFADLLTRKSARTRAEILLPGEIRGIREVLSNVGLNQFITPGGYAFHLSHAATIMVNGRTILEVHGAYVNRDNRVLSCYRGCFWDSDGLGNIQELFIEAPPEEFPATKQTLKDILNSISWKNRS